MDHVRTGPAQDDEADYPYRFMSPAMQKLVRESAMKPASFQVEASQFIYERDHSMLFARMGTGKTLTNLLAMQDWLEAGDVQRVMVVAPLRVAKNVWRQERDKWRIPLTMALLTGEMSKPAQDAAFEADTDILLTNYEMAYKLMETDHGCDGVLFDELSKLRNPTGKRQKQARRGGFKIWTGCTGTPAPNGLTSIYGMAHAVGLGHLVGHNYDRWLRRHFYPADFAQTKWIPFKDTPDALADLIRPSTFVLEDDAVELPTIIRPPVDVQLPPALRAQYDELRATSELPDHEIVAGSAGVLRMKLRQVLSGFIYNREGDAIELASDYRFRILQDIVDEMNGQPLIIAYEFRAQLAMMQEKWPDLPFIGGGSKDDERTIRRWNLGELPLLGLHPASAGHGLNLQGGGNTIAWWQLPDDLELYDQLVARLARRGQEAGSVYSYEPCAIGTVDTGVRDQAHTKARTQDTLWRALRR